MPEPAKSLCVISAPVVWTSQYHIHALDFDAMSRPDTIQDTAQSLASEAMFPISQPKFPLSLFNYQLLSW
jgi:hypothetical protein